MELFSKWTTILRSRLRNGECPYTFPMDNSFMVIYAANLFFYFRFCSPVLVCLLLSLLCAVSFVLLSFCLAGAQLVATVNDT